MTISVKAKWLSSALAAAALALLVPTHEAGAASWPNRPVRFIVPLGPGSGVDIGARLFADKLAARWGQSVIVENRPGGDGMVASPEMAADVRTRIADDVRAVAADPMIVQKMIATGQTVSPGNSAEFAASIAQQKAQVAAVAKLFGNKPVQ